MCWAYTVTHSIVKHSWGVASWLMGGTKAVTELIVEYLVKARTELIGICTITLASFFVQDSTIWAVRRVCANACACIFIEVLVIWAW